MKVLLLHPLVPFRVIWGKFHKGGGFIPPIGLMTIAAYVRQKGYDVEIVDTGVEGMDEAGLVKFLKDKRYDVVGIPCFTNTARYTFMTADLVKRVLPGALVVLGGVHATVLPEKSLAECAGADVVVIGEGELTFAELLDWKAGKRSGPGGIDGVAYRDGNAYRTTRPRQHVADLDSLPMPAYDLIKMERYTPHPTQYKRLPSFPLLATRGCPFLCTFCSASKVHGKRLRVRGLDAVFQEIDYLIRAYGAKGLYIQDSSFTHSKRYVADFCERLIAGKYNLSWMCNARVDQIDPALAKLMKRAGCWQVTFGIESANESSLALIKKHQDRDDIVKAVQAVKQAGMQIMACYILGLPGESAQEVENTIALARKLATHTALFFLPVPYPGTELLEQCRGDGGLREDVVWDDYSSTDFANPIYVNPVVGKEKLLQHYNAAYRRFYSSPKVVMNNLLSIRSWDDVMRYWRAFNALLGLVK